MKRVKKLLTMVMALAMVFSMSMTAFAQDVATGNGGNGTITVNNASKGVTYTLYKVFDASVGEKGEIVYTKANLTENDYFGLNESGNVVAKPAAYETGSKDQLSAGAIAWIKENGTEVKSVESDGTALQFTGLEYGYYYITSSLKADGGAITVTSTNPSATVKDKNSEKPGWTPDEGENKGGKSIVLANGKTVKANDMNIGDTATFQLSINTSNFVDGKQIREYVVEDNIPDGFTFESIESVQVNGADAEYTATNGSFPISVSWYGTNSDGAQASLYPANAKLVITYKAKLNEKAVIAGAGNINTAKFGWNYKDDPTTDVPTMPTKPDQLSTEEKTTTSTYAIALKKVNEKGQALTGAKFSVPFAVTGTAGEYTVTGAGNTEVECDANGVVVIKGVKAGTYSITETTAPDGYNKLATPFNVEAVKTGEITTNTTVYLDATGAVTDKQTDTAVTYTNNNLAASVKVVVNKAGSLLPSTGGMGTTIFTVTGAILMLIAAVIFVTRRRMKNVQ